MNGFAFAGLLLHSILLKLALDFSPAVLVIFLLFYFFYHNLVMTLPYF